MKSQHRSPHVIGIVERFGRILGIFIRIRAWKALNIFVVTTMFLPGAIDVAAAMPEWTKESPRVESGSELREEINTEVPPPDTLLYTPLTDSPTSQSNTTVSSPPKPPEPVEEAVRFTLTADPGIVGYGEQATFHLRLVNHSTEPLFGLRFTDHLETGFTFVKSWHPLVTYNERNKQVTAEIPYAYLAGRLIRWGVVDAGGCPGLGLGEKGYANPCGVEAARPQALQWQNRFDAPIFNASQRSGVPPLLIKQIFAQESQFWPGRFIASADERGLGQLTPNGADTLLLWNPETYQQICPQALHPDRCRQSYPQLLDSEKELIQGVVMQRVDAHCERCPMGMDLAVAEGSVAVFADVLRANCQQVGQIVSDLRGQAPGEVSSYADLWRYTLANYHAGSGCLLEAMRAIPPDQPLAWENLSLALEQNCPGASAYVADVIGE